MSESGNSPVIYPFPPSQMTRGYSYSSLLTVHNPFVKMVALKNLVQILPLIAVPVVAAPNYLRFPTSATELATTAFDSAQSWIHGAISEAKNKWDAIEQGVESKVHSEMIVENDIECE